MTEDAPLTERQQAMMAYIDEELGAVERREFEQAMASDPELAMETARFKNLMDLSRSLELSEPTDHEMRRFWARFYNRIEWRIGWVLLLGGLVVLSTEGLFLLLSCDLPWTIKAAVVSCLLGGLLLVWNAARLKIRTSHFDRYRGVMR